MKRRFGSVFVLALIVACDSASATPANLAALKKYYERFLPTKLANCATCHVSDSHGKLPASLAEFPHNSFGSRLLRSADQLRLKGMKTDIATRLRMIAGEDAGGGLRYQEKILLGISPAATGVRPTPADLARLPKLRAEFTTFLASYRWQPFESVKRPSIPRVKDVAWVRNPIDAFVAYEHEKQGLRHRPAASKPTLLRRATFDLTGLAPTPSEIAAFEADRSPDAYEKQIDRLLASPRYGERWGRHWMDVWRYSDWAGWADGGQIRDSKPHIWRWKEWIIESLNQDKGYDQMLREMLAADELLPEDSKALRATGFLVRNYKLLSREQWMEDTLNHTTRAFMGVTMHCAKCHDHMYDPFTQKDYYRLRAIFEPHNVRTDRVPGQPNIDKDGLVRTYDADPKAATYFFVRGDERNPDKTQPLLAAVPPSLGGKFEIKPVAIPRLSAQPDKRDFVVEETLNASQKAVEEARDAVNKVAKETPARLIAVKNEAAAAARLEAFKAVLSVEKLEDDGKINSEDWKRAAQEAVRLQRLVTITEAALNQELARKALKETEKAAETANAAPDQNPKRKTVADLEAAKKKFADANKAMESATILQTMPLDVKYKPRVSASYPTESTGRRAAFAQWLTQAQHPLTARVAVNQIWMRHFAEGLVPSTSDFGRNGRKPTHPQLLDWLAAELMTSQRGISTGWGMKRIHRLIMLSNTYRQSSTPDSQNARIDPDNNYLWRMPSKRLEAELVRDNVLWTAGSLDETMGGPDLDQNLGLSVPRRSLYFRIAAEKEVEFLKIFDGPSVTECYERKQTVMPQQALALANSELAMAQSKILAEKLTREAGADDRRFLNAAFLRLLSRRPSGQEAKLCLEFLSRKATTEPVSLTPANGVSGNRNRDNLILVLYNHNDFLTIR